MNSRVNGQFSGYLRPEKMRELLQAAVRSGLVQAERMQRTDGVDAGFVAGIRLGPAPIDTLQFELIDVHVGVNTIGILYRSVGRRRVIELLTFNSDKQVIRGSGLYGGPA